MRYEKTEYAHVRRFDSMEDLIESCKRAAKDSPNIHPFHREKFVGMDFGTWDDVYTTARQPWDEGIGIVERMVAELDSIGLPKPKSRKRKSRFAEDDGDELDYDRLRTGQPFWRTCRRENLTGPQTVTLVIDLAAPAKTPHEDVLWRGAAAIAITKVLEEAGFRVQLYAACCSRICYRDKKDSVNSVCLKSAGDPLDMGTLASTISGWCFRSLWFRAKAINASPKAGLGYARSPSSRELVDMTGVDNAICVNGVFSEYAATWLAKSIIKRIAGIEDPPPPFQPFETEPAVTNETTPEPAPAPKPKTKAELRAEAAAQRKADREWRQWLKEQEKKSVIEQ
jgi:hypothetical protein